MYLKQLDVQGFKSFPDKVRFEFIRGITAVVGPNGSGKSNVSDAIKWVLGEQSAKSLRGSKMEDVIFSGTVNRKALGFAEVSLTLDNSDGALKLDYNEVTISRRVFRSGESEYQINGTFCRLKDIHELLMDTGIGREGYSIIGQGRIDEILSSRPEERRYIFEEAAGIVKYKSRKNEAEAKLEKEKQNLLRVNDIIVELEAQLTPLYIQSEKAVKYLELKDKLKVLQVNIFLLEATRADDEIKSYNESLLSLNSQTVLRNENLEGVKDEIAALKNTIKLNANETKVESEALINTRLLQEQKENEVKLTKQQIEHITAGIGRLDNNIRQKVVLIKNKDNELHAEEIKNSGLDADFKLAIAEITESEKVFKQINDRMSDDEQKINNYNNRIIELIDTSTDIKSNIQRLNNNYERLEERKERLQDELLYNNTRKTEKTSRVEELCRLSEITEQDIMKLEAELSTLNSEKAANQAVYQGKKAEFSVLQQELTEKSAKYKILSDLENDYEGYNRSVKSIFTQKIKEPHRFENVFGTVGELLDVPDKFETAVETALAGTIQNIVVSDEYTAKTSIEFLKQVKAGRATFLPLTAVKPKSGSDMRDKLSGEKGYLGIASDLVNFDPKYSNIFLNLLGRVVVTDDMDNAVRIFKKYNYEMKIVTLDGELLSPGGAMTGGSSNRKSMNILGRGREIKELSQRIEKLEKSKKVLTTELDKLTGIAEIISERTEQNISILRKKQSENAARLQELDQIKTQLEEHEMKIIEINEEDSKLMEQLIQTNIEIRTFEEESKAFEIKIAAEKKNLEDFQNTLITDRNIKNSKMNELMELKSKAGALEQSLKSSRENMLRIKSEINSYNNEIQIFQAEIADNVQLKEQKEFKITSINNEITTISEKQSELRDKLELLNTAALDYADELQKKELHERNLLEELSKLNTDTARIETKKEQLENDIRKLYDTMWDEYKLTYIGAKEYPKLDMSQPALNREEKRVKGEISALGDVNVSAVEEYKNVKSRFDFLTKQRDDITSAEEKLGLVIDELVTLMELRFMEQFEKISENFGIAYKEIFSGGNAYLKLTDPNNVLASGIEIVSHPPGKNINNISLLSGGEHALTAIALLFGILRLKPSPFCLLDEIESSLDDANVARFASYLKKFAGESQFIVITHRKGTMEAADVLYGITMQEQGISKPVSVRFSQEAV